MDRRRSRSAGVLAALPTWQTAEHKYAATGNQTQFFEDNLTRSGGLEGALEFAAKSNCDATEVTAMAGPARDDMRLRGFRLATNREVA